MTKPVNRILNLENDSYNLESFYKYWQNNKETIENEIKNQFNVNIRNLNF